MQRPLIYPKSDWTAPSVSALPSWAGARRVGLDIETFDPNLKRLGPGCRREDGFIAGVSFSLSDKHTFYVPLRHLDGGNITNVGAFWQYLRENVKKFRGEVVGANLPYDLDWVGTEPGVVFDRSVLYHDICMASSLINSLHFTHGLDVVAERLGVLGKDESLLAEAADTYQVDKKTGMWMMHARFVGPYAEWDAQLPLHVAAKQRVTIDQEQLDEVWDLERRLLPVVLRMRQRGVRLDDSKLDEIEILCLKHEDKARGTVGTDSWWTPKALATVLREKCGIIVPKTGAGTPSIKKGFLEQEAFVNEPVVQAILEGRSWNKLRTTFVQGLRDHTVNGRVHCEFKQVSGDDGGARFGRMSCVKPNLQNQPSKESELGQLIRSAFLPDHGKIWAACDYSAQEPRMLVHWAERYGCIGAKTAGEAYRRDPETDHHRMMASLIFDVPQKFVTKSQRKSAKVIFLGLCYGMGSAKLAEDLGLETQKLENGFKIAGPDAMRLLNRFHERVPFVQELDRLCQKQAKQFGYIRTLSGRICRFPKDDRGRYDWIRTALNRIIQGSAADQTKRAMLLADEAGFELQLQIHDELDMSVVDKHEADRLALIMIGAQRLKVPSAVSVEIGENWAAASPPEELGDHEKTGAEQPQRHADIFGDCEAGPDAGLSVSKGRPGKAASTQIARTDDAMGLFS